MTVTAGSSQANDTTLIWILKTVQMTQYSTCASATWLVYDSITTMDDEVELIWRSPHTPPKYLYFFSRYCGLLAQFLLLNNNLFPTYCRNRSILQYASYTLLHMSVQISLMIRVYALWGQTRKILWCLIIGFIFGEAGYVLMLSFGAPSILDGAIPFPPGMPQGLHGCFITGFPNFFRLCWLPTLLFETLLFVLSTISCLSFRPLQNTPTVIRVFRDGTVYYAVIFLVLFLTTVGAYFPMVGLGAILDSWLPAVFSYSGSHLLLSIRRLAADRQRRFNLVTGTSTHIPSFIKPDAAVLGSVELQELSNQLVRGSSLLFASGTENLHPDVEHRPADERNRGVNSVHQLEYGSEIPVPHSLPSLALYSQPSNEETGVPQPARRWIPNSEWLKDWEYC